MRKRRPSLSLLVATALATSALLIGALPAAADAPPGPFANDFTTDTSGWFGTITRQPSGYTNSSAGYANGIGSASAPAHARLNTDDPCVQDCEGPFTRWGGYNQTFPSGGYRTYVAIYLDTTWAGNNPDRRFDFTSAVTNGATGMHLRDFAFNAGTSRTTDPSPKGFYINASTNAGRSGANPYPSCPPGPGCRTPVLIRSSGWYTFRHTFRNSGGFLAVDFDIFPLGSGTAVPGGHWTIVTSDCFAPCTPAPTYGVVGGNRYGWFANEEIPDLAIDNSLRTGLNLSLTPSTAMNLVGSSHTVTATATSTEPPYPSSGAGIVVEFDVTNGPNMGQSSHLPPNGGCSPSDCTTDSSGKVSWTYTSNGAPGTDTIKACFAQRPGTANPAVDDPRTCMTASKTWGTSTGKVTGGGQIQGDPLFAVDGTLMSVPALVPSVANPGSQASFGFVVQSNGTPKGNLEYNDKPAGVRIKAISIDSLFITTAACGAHAEFTGTAQVTQSTGTSTEDFTVKVDDCGEPGTMDTFGISTDTYSNGPSLLIGGNIQIHN